MSVFSLFGQELDSAFVQLLACWNRNALILSDSPLWASRPSYEAESFETMSLETGNIRSTQPTLITLWRNSVATCRGFRHVNTGLSLSAVVGVGDQGFPHTKPFASNISLGIHLLLPAACKGVSLYRGVDVCVAEKRDR